MSKCAYKIGIVLGVPDSTKQSPVAFKVYRDPLILSRRVGNPFMLLGTAVDKHLARLPQHMPWALVTEQTVEGFSHAKENVLRKHQLGYEVIATAGNTFATCVATVKAYIELHPEECAQIADAVLKSLDAEMLRDRCTCGAPEPDAHCWDCGEWQS